jgi:hypothetical protein
MSKSLGSLVGKAIAYGLDDEGKEFSLLHMVQTGTGAHPLKRSREEK